VAADHLHGDDAADESQLPVHFGPRPIPPRRTKPPGQATVGFDSSYSYLLQVNNDPRETIDYTALPARLNAIVTAEPDKLITCAPIRARCTTAWSI